jgi:hypothetical protein
MPRGELRAMLVVPLAFWEHYSSLSANALKTQLNQIARSASSLIYSVILLVRVSISLRVHAQPSKKASFLNCS